MSLAIWPSLPPAGLKTALATTQSRELAWVLEELGSHLRNLKLSLEDCYALLGPTGRGNTLVVSTPRNETVKGHITRLGTQIVKGTMHLRLRTLHPQTLTIDPAHPITVAPLDNLNTLLARSIELLALILNYAYPGASPPEASNAAPPPIEVFLAAQMRVLAQALQDAIALLRGPDLTAADPLWQTLSAQPAHFEPPLPPNISFYLGLQESQLVLWLRGLEPAGAPVNLGMKFALALGTARRLEHDEADQVFTYCCEDGHARGLHPEGNHSSNSNDSVAPTLSDANGPAEVYVREKVRVESADPSLLSVSAKLSALSHSLLLARRNLAAVMGEEVDD